jgi:hypothetical protein
VVVDALAGQLGDLLEVPGRDLAAVRARHPPLGGGAELVAPAIGVDDHEAGADRAAAQRVPLPLQPVGAAADRHQLAAGEAEDLERVAVAVARHAQPLRALHAGLADAPADAERPVAERARVAEAEHRRDPARPRRQLDRHAILDLSGEGPHRGVAGEAAHRPRAAGQLHRLGAGRPRRRRADRGLGRSASAEHRQSGQRRAQRAQRDRSSTHHRLPLVLVALWMARAHSPGSGVSSTE